MDKRQLYYMAAAGGGIYLLHLLRSRGKPKQAAVGALGDLMDVLPIPRIENPLMRRVTRRAVDLAAEAFQSQQAKPVGTHSPVPLAGHEIRDAEFTIIPPSDEDDPL